MTRSFFQCANTLLVFAVIGVFSMVSAQEKLPKLTAEEILAKHVGSIGTPEALAAAKSRVMVGEGSLLFRSGATGSIGGPAQLATEGNKFLFVMILSAVDYPYEKIAFDGKDMTAGRPSARYTQLAEFLKSSSGILKDGLFGGTLSSAWPFLPGKSKKLKFQSVGTSTVDGVELYKIEYIPSGGSVRAVFFFEPVTFRHVMTEYKVEVSPRLTERTQVTHPTTYYTLTERFADFSKAGDLTLPLNYTLDYSSSVDEISRRSRWTIRIKEVYYNEVLDASVFKVS